MTGRRWGGNERTGQRASRSAALLALCGLLVVTGLPGLVTRSAAKEAADWPAAELYVVEPGVEDRLTPLDGATLAPRSDGPIASLGSSGYGWMPALSEDGSTLAVPVESARAVAVRDGLFGPERVRVEIEGEAGELFLSRDGARLVVNAWNRDGLSWHTFDARDGRLLGTLPGDSSASWQVFAVDVDGGRLYRLTLADASGTIAGPRPTRLIVHDLIFGAELGRVDLPAIRAGFWQDEEIVAFRGGGQEPLMRALEPALALSPAGDRLAIAHADEASLTFVDTETLTVEGTREIVRSEGWLSWAAGWLGLAPQSAAAKAMEGTTLRAVFAPDGRRLYVYGSEATMEEGMPTYRGRPVQAIDVESGEVVGEYPGEMQIDRVLPSPDGGSVYVTGLAAEPTNARPSPPFAVRRLDAATLEPLAEHSLPSWRAVLVRSALADPALPLTVELTEMAFVPGDVVVPAGATVELVLTNHGEVAHNVTVDDSAGGLDLRADLAPGETTRLTLTAPAGEYKLFCAVAGHPEAGMEGVLVAR